MIWPCRSPEKQTASNLFHLVHVALAAIFESGQSSCMEAAAISALKQMLSPLSAGAIGMLSYLLTRPISMCLPWALLNQSLELKAAGCMGVMVAGKL